MIFNIHEAKTHLSHLVQRAISGEEIIVAKAGEPLVRLLPVHHRSEPRILGSWTGKVHVAEDFDAPLPDDMLDLFLKGSVEPEQGK
ncbi:MAG: type II toxin-antitoxin system prevent-host-death family antitoxin [Magnetococcus sp. DMHC-1]